MTRMPEAARKLPDPPGVHPRPAAGRNTQLHPEQHRVWSSLLTTVNAYVEACGGGEGRFETPMEGVNILRAFRHIDGVHRVYAPSLCVVVQGAKQFLLGEDTLDYGTMQCLVVSMEIPACGRIIAASPSAPFIGVTIDFDVAMMRDVLAHLDTPPAPTPDSGPNLFVTDVDEALAECVLRLVRMTETPKAIPILYPSAMREIYFWLLSGPHGGEICKLAALDTHLDRISKAILVLRNNFAQTLRVEQLAEAAGMSPSSFHQHFKTLTSMTPLQFQKNLRLLEARRLMISDALSVGEAAYRVGYVSSSQFSREYSRMFGVPPKRDAMGLKVEAV